jgi:4-amino-4-deoxy-L-arabinose transferase-like glycosyltransferase
MAGLNRKHIFILLGIILVIRLCVTLLLSGNIPVADAKDYNIIAQSLLNKGIFADEIGNCFSRPPLYPYFLYGLYKLYGISYPFVYYIQSFISLLICYISYILGKEICNKKTGLIAFFLTGINIELIVYPTFLLSETLFIFLFIISLYCLFRYLREENGFLSKWGILSGLFLGTATLTRPITLGLSFFCLIVLSLFSLFRPKFRSFVFKISLTFIVMLLVITPWSIRNYMLSGKIIPVSAIDGVNFWIGHHHGANGSYDWPIAGNPLMAESTSELAMNKQGWTEGLSFIKTHPLEEIKITILKSIRMLLPFPDYSFQMSGFLMQNRSLYWICCVFSAVIWEILLVIICLNEKMLFKDGTHLLLSLILFYFIFNQLIFFSTPRYKVPIILLLILIAAECLAKMKSITWRAIKWKRTGLLFGLQLISFIVLFISRNFIF